MRNLFFGFIGLVSLYLLIFRTESINNNLAESKNRFSNDQLNDTMTGRPLYIDIYTGDSLDLWYDSVKFVTVNRKTNRPVEFFINTVKWDTVYGRGWFVVNNFIIKNDHGQYKLDENKVRMEGGNLKIKDRPAKLKIHDEIKTKGDKKLKNKEAMKV